jgi:tRNA nucleotidyltransferase (CCA-adding enzyme)
MISTGEQMLRFLYKVQELGFTPYLVGGAVIDRLVGKHVTDWDIEVHGCSLDELKSIVLALGLKADFVGAEFGIVFSQMDGVDIDLSVPRRENKVGKGYKGFEVSFDPNMTVEEASLRRDLTINAMMVNMLTEELVDPHGGLQDLKDGCIRAVNHGTFAEDPLRVLRIMQILPRKGKFVEESTKELARSLSHTFPELTADNVGKQFRKLLLKAAKPSIGLSFLREVDWIQHFPELSNLIGVQQSPLHHPEGDVWNHTLMVLDAAAEIRNCIADEKMQLAFMFAALLHDAGKAVTTAKDLTSYGHDRAGIPLAESFLKRMKVGGDIIETVKSLVATHMQPGLFVTNGAKLPAWRRLHNKQRLDILFMLALADHAGRTGHSISGALEFFSSIPSIIVELGTQPIKPVVTGRDLIALGLQPGPEMGRILKSLFERQLNGESRESLLASLR